MMKNPYISKYSQVIIYQDKGVNPPETTVLTETVENGDEENSLLFSNPPETTIVTKSIENSDDSDLYLFSGPETTTTTFTIENDDKTNQYYSY